MGRGGGVGRTEFEAGVGLAGAGGGRADKVDGREGGGGGGAAE